MSKSLIAVALLVAIPTAGCNSPKSPKYESTRKYLLEVDKIAMEALERTSPMIGNRANRDAEARTVLAGAITDLESLPNQDVEVEVIAFARRYVSCFKEAMEILSTRDKQPSEKMKDFQDNLRRVQEKRLELLRKYELDKLRSYESLP